MQRANNSHPGRTGTYGANIHSGCDKRSLSNVSTNSSLVGNRNRPSSSCNHVQPFLHSYLPSCWADSKSRCIQVSISCWETPRATYTCPSLLTSSGQMAICWFSSCCCSGLIVIPSRNRGQREYVSQRVENCSAEIIFLALHFTRVLFGADQRSHALDVEMNEILAFLRADRGNVAVPDLDLFRVSLPQLGSGKAPSSQYADWHRPIGNGHTRDYLTVLVVSVVSVVFSVVMSPAAGVVAFVFTSVEVVVSPVILPSLVCVVVVSVFFWVVPFLLSQPMVNMPSAAIRTNARKRFKAKGWRIQYPLIAPPE